MKKLGSGSSGLPQVTTKAPSFKGRIPSSNRASLAAKGSSKKRDTSCEVRLRRALWRRGLRYRVNVRDLPGKPDIVFRSAKVVVFVDGDFWHGKDWEVRESRLRSGSNADYWVAKISRNRERDARNTAILESEGWTVLRFWEAEIKADVELVADKVASSVARGRTGRHGPEVY